VQLWLVLLGCCVALGLVALFAVLRLELDARGCGQPSGEWACAFGLELGPLTLSGVATSGAALRLELHGLGRRFLLRRRKPEPEKAEAAPLSARPAGAARLWRWLQQPASGLEPLRRVGRHVGFERLQIDASYGFQDIALTGKLAGALYALAGILPASVVLTNRPSWDGGERWELAVVGRLTAAPGRVLLELLWYMLRTRLGRRRPAPARPGPA